MLRIAKGTCPDNGHPFWHSVSLSWRCSRIAYKHRLVLVEQHSANRTEQRTVLIHFYRFQRRATSEGIRINGTVCFKAHAPDCLRDKDFGHFLSKRSTSKRSYACYGISLSLITHLRRYMQFPFPYDPTHQHGLMHDFKQLVRGAIDKCFHLPVFQHQRFPTRKFDLTLIPPTLQVETIGFKVTYSERHIECANAVC